MEIYVVFLVNTYFTFLFQMKFDHQPPLRLFVAQFSSMAFKHAKCVIMVTSFNKKLIKCHIKQLFQQKLNIKCRHLNLFVLSCKFLITFRQIFPSNIQYSPVSFSVIQKFRNVLKNYGTKRHFPKFTPDRKQCNRILLCSPI